MKLKDAICKSHLNNLISCVKSEMMSDLNISHEKMFDFVSFPLFGFHSLVFSHKMDKMDKSLWGFLIKKMMSDLNMSCQTMPNLVEASLLEYN